MAVLNLMEHQFLAGAGKNLLTRIASGEIDTAQKRKKLLSDYAEELLVRFPEWENLR